MRVSGSRVGDWTALCYLVHLTLGETTSRPRIWVNDGPEVGEWAQFYQRWLAGLVHEQTNLLLAGESSFSRCRGVHLRAMRIFECLGQGDGAVGSRTSLGR